MPRSSVTSIPFGCLFMLVCCVAAAEDALSPAEEGFKRAIELVSEELKVNANFADFDWKQCKGDPDVLHDSRNGPTGKLDERAFASSAWVPAKKVNEDSPSQEEWTVIFKDWERWEPRIVYRAGKVVYQRDADDPLPKQITWARAYKKGRGALQRKVREYSFLSFKEQKAAVEKAMAQACVEAGCTDEEKSGFIDGYEEALIYTFRQ